MKQIELSLRSQNNFNDNKHDDYKLMSKYLNVANESNDGYQHFDVNILINPQIILKENLSLIKLKILQNHGDQHNNRFYEFSMFYK